MYYILFAVILSPHLDKFCDAPPFRVYRQLDFCTAIFLKDGNDVRHLTTLSASLQDPLVRLYWVYSLPTQQNNWAKVGKWKSVSFLLSRSVFIISGKKILSPPITRAEALYRVINTVGQVADFWCRSFCWTKVWTEWLIIHKVWCLHTADIYSLILGQPPLGK